MRIIVSLSDRSDATARQQAIAKLEKHGFQKARNQEELAAFGMLVGELPDEQFEPLRKRIVSGGLSGVDSLEPDAGRRAKSDGSKGR